MRSVIVAFLVSLAACGSKGGNSPEPEGPGGGPGGRCAQGEHFVPGCSDEPGIVAGCYVRCATGAGACGPGTTCQTAHVMPACALAEGDVQCDACGEDVMLCLPSSE